MRKLPTYKVLSASDKVVPVCNLIVEDEQGKIQSINVRNMSGGAAQIFVGKTINVETTNRDIVPSDIRLQTSATGSVWVCEGCGMVNPESSPYCRKCGDMRAFEKEEEEEEGGGEPE